MKHIYRDTSASLLVNRGSGNYHISSKILGNILSVQAGQ